MTILVEQDPTLVDLLRAAVSEGVSVLAGVDQVEDHLRRHRGEHVVVLGPSVSDADAAAFAEQNRVLRPSLGVILVRPAVDSTVLADALRSGMSQVVETRDGIGLQDAVRRAQELALAMDEGRRQHVEPSAKGSLVTVFSTKGGVGKSLVATNVGAALADQGHRVCVVDLDVHGGDVAIMLQLTPQHTLADLARMHGALDAAGVESLLTQHSERLFVLAAPVQLGSSVPAESIGSVLAILKGLFDVVVVDTSGAFDDYGLHAFDHSELLVLVGTLDIPALKSLKLAVGTLDLLNFPRDRWRLLLNRADAKVGLSIQEFEDTLGLKVTASVPSNRDVLAAVNRGEPIVLAKSSHEVSKVLSSFATGLARDVSANPEVAEPPRRTHRAMLRRGARSEKVA